VLLGVLVLCIGMATVAQATERVTVNTAFLPDKLGVNTTIEFGFNIIPTGGAAVPSPLTEVSLHLPAGMDLGSSTLGQDTCHPEALILRGVAGCPRNSLMGLGSALVELLIGGEVIREAASVAAFIGPSEDEHTVVLFYAEGVTPVATEQIFRGQLLPDSRPYGGRLDTMVPLIESVPGADDVSVVRFQSSIGPRHIVYVNRRHGRPVAFSPRGIAIPTVCPPGGFPISADFSFLDGAHITVKRPVRCPRRKRWAK
jgi:hypothetical protein